jgi:hypothetical protein
MTGNYQSKGGAAALGYRAGAGALVTQLTSKATTVIINKASGVIVSAADSLAAAADVQFQVTNNLVQPDDIPVVAVGGASAATGLYEATVSKVDAGSFEVSLRNVGATASEAVTINFALLKGTRV